MASPCGTCGFSNVDAARFCGGCGRSLAATCPRCGTPAAPAARFCSDCGSALDASAPIAPRPPSVAPEPPAAGPIAERRRVSVLFIDLENFTSLAESLDPEELRPIQARYFEAARSVVTAYGGTIEKFIGDAVMAVWGAPAAHEDDAERAVRAALELVHAVARLGGAASGRALRARAAVTTGEAAVTVGATEHGMVSGDLVNAAARLQAEAPSGGVLVDEATRALLGEDAPLERVGELQLKGRSAPLVAYRVGADAGWAPAARVGTHAGPFVGRDRELRELVHLFEGVVRDRRCRLVSITGIAGVGKSRLVWEFREWLESLPDDVAWHEGRAPAYGNDTTFAAVSEMLRRRIRIPDGTPPELARRQLVAALPEVVRDEAERRWVEPRLAALLGSDGTGGYERDELFAAWRRFFERVADRGPTVLVFEDLQWADPSLLDFVEHVAAWARDRPILILALFRPELLDERAGWGSGVANATRLQLERLSDEATRALLTARAPSLAESLIDDILERAGGVPLYAVEVVGILGAAKSTAGGRKERRRAPRTATSTGAAQDIPDSLHGLIAARIDAVPREERRLLMAASVLGRRFRSEALAAVSGLGPAELAERTEALVRRELVAVNQELRSPGHGELAFVQDLVREVAYRTLTRTERRELHLAAARYLDGLAADDMLAESRANHLLEAHRLAPEHPDAPRVARRAVAALRQAAQHAMALHVPDRALGLLEHALRLNSLPEQRITLLEEAATAARASARLEVAEEHLRELVATHEAAKRRQETARARARLASVLLMAQRNASALGELEAAMRRMRNPAGDAVGVEITAQLARARMLMGEHAAGLEWAERALSAAEQLGLGAIAADVLVTRGTARVHLGDVPGGHDDLRRAIREAETAGSLSTELRARNNLAWLVAADDPRLALDTARHAVDLASAMGIGDLATQLAAVACAVAVDTGDWSWALEIAERQQRSPISVASSLDLETSCSIIRALRGDADPMAPVAALAPLLQETDPQLAAGIGHARAWTAFVGGSFADAAELAEQAADASFGAERLHGLLLAGRAHLWEGDLDGARRVADAIAELEPSGRAGEAALLTLRAGIAALEGDAGAEHAYRDAVGRWRELNLAPHVALSLLDRERLLPDVGDASEPMIALRELEADGLLRLVRTAPALGA